MARTKPAGPVCPACGYPIFGLREMRCPECGRTLDVRDFSVEGLEQRGDARRYERNSALGGLAALVVLLVVLAPMLLLAGVFAQHGLVSGHLVLLIGLVAATLVGVGASTARAFRGWFKSRK